MKKIFIMICIIGSNLTASSVGKAINVIENNSMYEIVAIDSSNLGVPKVSLESNNTKITLSTDANLSTVIYIIIDSSIPMKKAYVKGIKPFIKSTVPAFVSTNMQVIISTFDKDLKHMYDSSKNAKLHKALKKIKISGQTTELWRNVGIALNELKNIDKQRRILLVMSDGDAEDTPAYTWNNVVELAQKNNIRIASIAYRDKIVAQNLRKISEETNGKIWIANKATYKLNRTFIEEFAQFIASQFSFFIPKELVSSSLTGEEVLKVKFTHNTNSKTIDVKLRVNTLEKSLTFWEEYKLYLLTGAAFILLLLMFLLLKPKNEEIEENIIRDPTIIPEPFVPIPKPVAYFESMGGGKHEIFKFPSTIGKNISNDCVIDGQYISRSHALIDLKDGVFYITDTDSANGTTVNGVTVEGTVELLPNDKVEFGPYKTIFVLV